MTRRDAHAWLLRSRDGYGRYHVAKNQVRTSWRQMKTAWRRKRREHVCLYTPNVRGPPHDASSHVTNTRAQLESRDESRAPLAPVPRGRGLLLRRLRGLQPRLLLQLPRCPRDQQHTRTRARDGCHVTARRGRKKASQPHVLGRGLAGLQARCETTYLTSWGGFDQSREREMTRLPPPLRPRRIGVHAVQRWSLLRRCR